MPGTPTEVLNDDIKELKSDLRENRAKIDLVKEEIQRLALAQAEMKVELRDDIHRIALSQAEMKGEFRLVKLLLTVVIAGIAGSAWQFFNLNAKVIGIETRLDKVDSRLDKVDSRLDKVDSRLDKVDLKLESLANSVGRILEQTRPPAASQGPKLSPPAP